MKDSKIPNLRRPKHDSCYWCKHGDPQYIGGPFCKKYDEFIEDKPDMPVCDDFEDLADAGDFDQLAKRIDERFFEWPDCVKLNMP